MSTEPANSKLLNARNSLTAHTLCRSIDPALVRNSLRLTKARFPHEPTAADSLGRAYDILISGDGRMDDCELLEYFIYTVGTPADERVVGCSGIYRLLDESTMTHDLLDTLRSAPPQSVAFLKGHRYGIQQFVWGGRLAIDSVSAASPNIIRHVIAHVITAAERQIASFGHAPVLLAFTQRDDNERVQRFYEHLGFENTGFTLEYAGSRQDVFALNLSSGAPIKQYLSALTSRAATKPLAASTEDLPLASAQLDLG